MRNYFFDYDSGSITDQIKIQLNITLLYCFFDRSKSTHTTFQECTIFFQAKMDVLAIYCVTKDLEVKYNSITD